MQNGYSLHWVATAFALNGGVYTIFDRIMAKMKDGDLKGMVIIAHDATDGLTRDKKGNVTGKNPKQDDVSAVAADKKYMEDLAAKDGVNVRIEYVTMSDLFTRITGENIATYDVKY